MDSISKFYLLVVSLLTCGYLHADELEVFSVKEKQPGTLMMTVGVVTDAIPDESAFRLRFDDKTAIPASEVKAAAPSVPLEASIMLCVDQSGSMGRDAIKQIQEALKGALKEAPTKSKTELNFSLAVCTFDTEVRKLQGFTKDVAQLSKGVSKIGSKFERDSKTKLYEAIEFGLAELRSRDDKPLKRLVVVSDARDDGSAYTDKEAMASEAAANNIAIDAIGFGDNVYGSGLEVLRRFAENTGGRFVLATGADRAQELSVEFSRLFDMAAPRMFEVLFRYDVSEDGHQVKSAQLEFNPTGKESVSRTITQEFSAPRAEVSPASADDEWTIEIFSVKADVRVVIAIAAAILALFGVYKRGGKSRLPSSVSPHLPQPDSSGLSRPKAEPSAPRRATVVSHLFSMPHKGSPTAFLLCESGPGRGHEYAIEESPYRIGASKSNELQLSDDYVSQKHAYIKYESGSLYLSDSGSRNGTFLNNSRLGDAAVALSPGDEIGVGKTILKLALTPSKGTLF